MAILSSDEKYQRDLKRFQRIREIDEQFELADGWGSWMVAAANEREMLVNYLRESGHNVQHKHQARTGGGGRVD